MTASLFVSRLQRVGDDVSDSSLLRVDATPSPVHSTSARGSKSEFVVAIWGPSWHTHGAGSPTNRELSGCPNTIGRCPLFPKCRFRVMREVSADPKALDHVDVVVALTTSVPPYLKMMPPPHALVPLVKAARHRHPNVTFVLHQREAEDRWISAGFVQHAFDFTMGYSTRNALPNPLFVVRPNTLLSDDPVPSLSERQFFMLSLISHCHANSLRDEYLDRLIAALPGDVRRKTHRYGACGDHRHTIDKHATPEHFRKTVQNYAFFFGGENQIASGYTTEKLYSMMKLGIVVVYYGDPDVLSVTVSSHPSFVKVSDFPSPKALAKFLTELAKDGDRYASYFAYRTDPALFSPEFVAFTERVLPTREESEAVASLSYEHEPRVGEGGAATQRRILCCRLCDPEFLRSSKQTTWNLVERPWPPDKIKRKLF